MKTSGSFVFFVKTKRSFWKKRNKKPSFLKTINNPTCNMEWRIIWALWFLIWGWVASVWHQSRRFKKFKKIRLGSKLLLSLIYGSGFRIYVASIFQQNLVHKTGLMLYLVDFHSWNWCILGFDENKTQHWALFFTKTNQGRFYFHWA